MSQATAVAAIAASRRIVLLSYFLPRGPILRALLEAAAHGASVTVRLEAYPYAAAHLHAENARAAKLLRGAHADARLVRSGGAPLHAKALICDGVAYLDDRNWPAGGRDTIVRDDSPSHVRALIARARGLKAKPARNFWTSRADAVRAEARMLSSAHCRADVESESFGDGSAVFGALRTLARGNVPCRLIVSEADAANPRERRALRELAAAGVAIRLGATDEKLAVADATRGWVGSANASSLAAYADTTDWGLRTNAPAVVRTLRDHFERNWNNARAFRVVASATSSTETPSSSATRCAIIGT